MRGVHEVQRRWNAGRASGSLTRNETERRDATVCPPPFVSALGLGFALALALGRALSNALRRGWDRGGILRRLCGCALVVVGASGRWRALVI